ncbi:exo-beta-1,3-glucanase [Desulfocapsa sulfexigens DSM 10523]|uniref:Beta-monoglucosyldiacylglycerol synthase n=2 Tax=Desulfocapsa TaxID=53318 RepID=M1PLJ1_DESSD|nr:exo-beta-1,3-glucanase [Desulfocapsa sulfexigens DSM 10523]
MLRVNILICIVVALICTGLWAIMNRPGQEPVWPSRIQGFSFSPLREGDNPSKGQLPSEEEIEADLALLANKTNAIRTYTVNGVYESIPRLAYKHNINVALGAWLDKDLEKNEKEIAQLIKIARENYRNVVRVVVGNETVLRGDLTVKQLNSYLDRVQAALDIPVGTAEPWHIWIKEPSLGEHVDYIGAHMLPYWEGIELQRAVGHVTNRTSLLMEKFPNKPVAIMEVGWPSNGRTIGRAQASPSNEATFLRRFLKRAEKEKYVYYVMEAFDQPWKQASEGAVGAYWGVYDLNRHPKFPFDAAIISIPEWKLLAGISVLIAFMTSALLFIDSRSLSSRGRGFLTVIAFSAASMAVLIIYNYFHQYLTVSTTLIGVMLVTGMTGVVLVLLTEAHEWAEATWIAYPRRPFIPIIVPDQELPMVSIHVPTYNEPPDMMKETLQALSRLDYPNFEVIVIDNNTKDPNVWQPVAEFCKQLGPRFRFFHEDPLPGFKAGALNFTLAKTAPEAEVVAVIDSDYAVEPQWLRELASQFTDTLVAIVQAPQDYRDSKESLFKSMCYSEYKGFFLIGMVTRNERNAIIQHGTMTMVRRSVLEDVNGWAEWCITEDAELGLRIFEKGHKAVYIAESYGKGLMPDTFNDFKKQRFRWAYGAVQILRRHAQVLFRHSGSGLTRGQRYHFIAGWLPWIADSANLLFTLSALVWSVAMALFPDKIESPLLILTALPLTLFIFKLAKMLYLYRQRVKASILQTVASALAGLALSHTISKAILLGFVTSGIPFARTPKNAASHALLRALQSAREEALIMLALWLSAYSVMVIPRMYNTPDTLVWFTFLLVQSIPYMSAVFMAIISSFSTRKNEEITL